MMDGDKLSPKNENAESTLKAKCDAASVVYEPPTAGEGMDERRKRINKLSKACTRRGLSDEDREKEAQRKREQRKSTPTKRSDEDRDRDAKRKREERQKEKERQEEEARERAIKRAALERSSQTMDEQEEEYGQFLQERGVTPRVLGSIPARAVFDMTQYVNKVCKIGNVKVSTVIAPLAGVKESYRACRTDTKPSEGYQDLEVEKTVGIRYSSGVGNTTYATVGGYQKKIVHIEGDPPTLHSMEQPVGSGIFVSAIKCLHPATWEGNLKYLTKLVSVTECDPRARVLREGYDFSVEDVFPWGEVSTATKEDQGYVICGDSSYCELEGTNWFAIDQRLLMRYGNISPRDIVEIMEFEDPSKYEHPFKYEQLLTQYVVSAFSTHDTAEHDSRVKMSDGDSYGKYKRKYLKQNFPEEYADAKGEGGRLSLSMEKQWPLRTMLNPCGEKPDLQWVQLTSRYLNNLIPEYEAKGLVRDDRHCVISPFGMLSRREEKDRSFTTEPDTLDRVRIPDRNGCHNVTSFQVPVEEILHVENGYIHRIGEGYERKEPRCFQVTGRDGLPVYAYGDLRGGRHVVYPDGPLEFTGYFSDEDRWGLSKTSDDYMFSVEMQTKVGVMSFEELQELEIHIDGSKEADMSKSSCKSSVDQSSLKLCYKWNSVSSLSDDDCWVKLHVDIDIDRSQRGLGAVPSSREDLSLEHFSAGQTLVVKFTTIAFTTNMLKRGGQLHAMTVEDYNESCGEDRKLNTPLGGLGIEKPITVKIERDKGPALPSRHRCRGATREEEIDHLLRVSNSPPGKSNSAQLRFGVGQFVDCWVPGSRWRRSGCLVNGRVVELWSRVAPGIGNPVWAGMKQNLSLRWAPYKVELTDARGMNFYVPLDKDMFIRASSTPSPRYFRHAKNNREHREIMDEMKHGQIELYGKGGVGACEGMTLAEIRAAAINADDWIDFGLSNLNDK